MPIQIVLDSVRTYGLPLRNTFRGTNRRNGALIEGPSGWADFAPFDNYDDVIAGRWLAASLEQSFGTWPEAQRHEIPVNGILPIVDVATTKTLTQEILDRGMSTIKIKVADGSPESLVKDIERIASVREVAGPDVHIRIDVNGAWTATQAVASLREIVAATGQLDYVEQPCSTLDELSIVKQELNGLVPIAVDESIRLATKLDAAAIREVADIVIVKSIPIGGVQASLDLIQQIGLPVVVSGSLDTSVGLTSGLQLAGCVDNLYGACGLGTGLLFEQDIVSHPLLPVDGTISVGRVSPDKSLLAAWHSDNQDEWKARIVRAWEASAIHLVSDQVREAVTA